MNLIQYGDYFYLYILFLISIPAVVLKFFGLKNKYYGLAVSIVLDYMVIGGKIGLELFLLFLIGETAVIYVYLFIRKKTDNKYIYFLFLFFSIIPLIIVKIAGLTKYSDILGFVGLSYINFKAIQMVIEIYDGRITKINFTTFLYFIMFFPTLSSGPIDRWMRFEGNLTQTVSRTAYINEYLFEGIKKIVIGVFYKFIMAYMIHTYWLLKIPKDINLMNSINYMYAYTTLQVIKFP